MPFILFSIFRLIWKKINNGTASEENKRENNDPAKWTGEIVWKDDDANGKMKAK